MRFGGRVRIEIAPKHLKPHLIVFGRFEEVAASSAFLYRLQFSDTFCQVNLKFHFFCVILSRPVFRKMVENVENRRLSLRR